MMSPRKRRGVVVEQHETAPKKKRISITDRERLICKKKLDALELEETRIKDDRFSPAERVRLLDAYHKEGYNVFQDTKLLHKYLPNRKESDLKGLVQRFKTSIQASNAEGSESEKSLEHSLDEWQKLCQQLLGNFAKDKKINLDDIIPDALMDEAGELDTHKRISTTTASQHEEGSDDQRPDYPKLLKSFAQLIMGKFPDSMSPINAQLSIRMFEHVNSLVDSRDLTSISNCLESGTWLEATIEQRRQRQELALKGLSEFDWTTKKCPTVRDLERNQYIEALCLELPKIKRITDVLNPLRVNESLVSTLMEQ